MGMSLEQAPLAFFTWSRFDSVFLTPEIHFPRGFEMTVRDLTILGCSSQQPTRFRNHGAYLVRWNEEGFLFDPGEGTQRQFIFAGIAPPTVNRIFISHFHGDHCLGLGSMLMRLNLDRVTHPIHCYYPASGKKYFHRLRYGTSYHETITVIEHPITDEGIIEDDGKFRIEARWLEHGIDNLGWRITEPDSRKFDPKLLTMHGLHGPIIKELHREGRLMREGRWIDLDDVSSMRKGDSLAVVIDTRLCNNAYILADQARLLLCESTYLEPEKTLAYEHYHLTALQAAELARDANARELILTHFSARYLNSKLFEDEARRLFPNTHAADDFNCYPFPKNG